LRKAIALFAGSWLLHEQLSWALERQGRLDEALTSATDAVALRPDAA